MKVYEMEKGTTPIGARVNSHFVSLLKESEIPISTVVESMIGYFLTLSDEEKARLIYQNMPKNLCVEQIKYPEWMWPELERRYKKEGG